MKQSLARMGFLVLSLAVAGDCSHGQAPKSAEQVVIQDPAQLVGKRINVQRLPLCEPGTYKGDFDHAGLIAAVLSAEPQKTIPTISKATLDRMPPNARDMMLDEQKAALLLLQFEDGAKRDTCAPISPKRLAAYIKLAPGETLDAASSTSAPPASPTSDDDRSVGGTTKTESAGGKWQVERQKDAMTDVPSEVFSLQASEQSGYLALRCSGSGRFEEAWFTPGVVLDNSNSAPRGLAGDQPNQLVKVRVDDKMKFHDWFVSADLRALTIGKRDLEEILKASDYRIEYTEAFSGSRVTQFAPGGIDRTLVKSACGIDLK